jgi:transposase-like protein
MEKVFRSDDEKRQIVKQAIALRKEGKKLSEASATLGIKFPGQIAGWVKEFGTDTQKRFWAEKNSLNMHGAKAVKAVRQARKQPSISKLYVAEELPQTRNDERVIVLLGPPKLVAEMMRNLQ